MKSNWCNFALDLNFLIFFLAAFVLKKQIRLVSEKMSQQDRTSAFNGTYQTIDIW